MIEVEILDVYAGGIYNKTIKRYIASSFSDVVKYVNKLNLNRDDFNTSHRVFIHTDDKKSIKDIPIMCSIFDKNDIRWIGIEYTIDMCTIIERIYTNNDIYDNDIFKDMIDIKIGDIVFNRRDGRYYLVVNDPDTWVLSDALWNDNNPGTILSRYDIHKATKYEYEYYNLHKLELLKSANSIDEYEKISDDICINHPRMMNYDRSYLQPKFKRFIIKINNKIKKFRYNLYCKKVNKYRNK